MNEDAATLEPQLNLRCHTLPAPPLGGFGKGRRASTENYNIVLIFQETRYPVKADELVRSIAQR